MVILTAIETMATNNRESTLKAVKRFSIRSMFFLQMKY